MPAAHRRTARVPPLVLGAILTLLLPLLFFISLRYGSTEVLDLPSTWRFLRAFLGLGDPLENQTALTLRAYRSLVALGVGAALGLSGAYLQGVFRNDLASPSIIGVSSGAALGASLAILALGGYGRELVPRVATDLGPFLVMTAALAGAFLTVLVVTGISSMGGRISVPTLLLVGIALNALLGGLLALIHSLVLTDVGVSRALLDWTFGTFHDRDSHHVISIFVGVAIAAAAIPFVATELDLFAGGEEDARTLGVHTTRTKVLAILAACVGAAAAMSVAGQILFVGLIVPHLVRLACGRSHRAVLPLSVLAGGFLLLGGDVLQWIFLEEPLQPGVMMSLVGGPFFLLLLVRNRSLLKGW